MKDTIGEKESQRQRAVKWSMAELALLKEEYGRRTAVEISRLIPSRTVSAIRARAEKLGFKSGYDHKSTLGQRFDGEKCGCGRIHPVIRGNLEGLTGWLERSSLRTCCECGLPFQAQSANHIFCSVKCRTLFNVRNYQDRIRARIKEKRRLYSQRLAIDWGTTKAVAEPLHLDSRVIASEGLSPSKCLQQQDSKG